MGNLPRRVYLNAQRLNSEAAPVADTAIDAFLAGDQIYLEIRDRHTTVVNRYALPLSEFDKLSRLLP